jgi:hypothetical protein
MCRHSRVFLAGIQCLFFHTDTRIREERHDVLPSPACGRGAGERVVDSRGGAEKGTNVPSVPRVFGGNPVSFVFHADTRIREERRDALPSPACGRGAGERVVDSREGAEKNLFSRGGAETRRKAGMCRHSRVFLAGIQCLFFHTDTRIREERRDALPSPACERGAGAHCPSGKPTTLGVR